MNDIATLSLPDEAAPPAEQTRTLADRIDEAMRMVRMAVEQYEALVSAPAETVAALPRHQPDPGTLFLRAARVVQNCIFGQSHAAAGRPIARPTRPAARETGDGSPLPAARLSRAEPVRQAPQTVPSQPTHGQNRLGASLGNRSAALAADCSRATDLPRLFRRVGKKSAIPLNHSLWRTAARDLACSIRAAPA